MKFLKLALLVSLLNIQAASAELDYFYVNLLSPENNLIPIYNNPKIHANNCTVKKNALGRQKACSEIIGYVKQNEKVKVLGSEVTGLTIDPFSGDEVTEIFIPISLNKHRGYIAKYNISEKKVTAFFQPEALPDKILDSRQPSSIKSKINDKKKASLSSATNKVYDLVGECVIQPADKLPDPFPEGNAFDVLVYSKISKVKRKKLPLVYGENNKQLAREDIINIDALARTIYGEMGVCFKKGLEYPAAAARVAINRLESKTRFKEWTGSKIKRKYASLPDFTQILTTPEKFNNWKPTINGKINYSLHHSLCPPKTVNKPFWKEAKANKQQVAIWKNAVRIATEAVLFRKKFKARSPNMKNINFYTSGLGEYNGYTQVFPIFNGRPLNDVSCIETWKEPTPKSKNRSVSSEKKNFKS